jgi:hypothetical protein
MSRHAGGGNLLLEPGRNDVGCSTRSGLSDRPRHLTLLTHEQNRNIVGMNKEGTLAMTAYFKDIAALIVVVAFVASIGVVHETVRMLM